MGHNERIKRDRRRQRWIALVLIFGLLFGGYALSVWYQQSLRLAVTFQPPGGKPSVRYHLEKADTPAKREKGLMFRKSLESGGGMIFFEEEDRVQRFWMRNTFISLDMIFVDKDKKVVGVVASVPILNEEPRFVDTPSRYVIELAAGSAARDGIVTGTQVQFVDP